MTTAHALSRLLRHAQTTAPDDVVSTLAEGAALLAGRQVVLHLVDYEHSVLQPTPAWTADGAVVLPASIEGTMAGRCFRDQQLLEAERDGAVQVWVPVSERAERLGVLAFVVPRLDEPGRDLCAELGLLAGQLILSSSAYCDRFHVRRRRRDMSLAAEMQWSLLPPLSFSCAGTSLAGLLEPAYDVGGDCFDYAYDDGVLHLAVFDAMGHGLPSSVLSSLAVGAYRHERRRATPLAVLLGAMDHAVQSLMGDAFVTALVGELQTATGQLRWTSAGHPPPLLLRAGRVLPQPEQSTSLPLGLSPLPAPEAGVQVLQLEPGDRVLVHTDGVVEARSPAGVEFGRERLGDLFARESASGALPAEVLRRLTHDCLHFQGGRLRDDATLLLLEWAGPARSQAASALRDAPVGAPEPRRGR